jgi:hypothetical protein
MKTKIFVLIVIGIFLISSFSAIGFQTNNTVEEINICLFDSTSEGKHIFSNLLH